MKLHLKWQEHWWELENLVKILIGVSLAVHVIGFVAGHFFSFSGPRIMDEIAIETDLISEADLRPASKTVIPKAKKADKAAVPSTMLPQINKDFQIKQPKKEEEGIADDAAKDVVPEGKKEEVKAEDPKVVEEEKDNSTKLAKLEALKRLAMEKLRQEQKEKSKELTAHENNELAQVKEALHKDTGLNKNVGTWSSFWSRNSGLFASLDRSIKKNWALPKTFQLTSADMKSTVAIQLSTPVENS